MNFRKKLGDAGETLAAQFLYQKGYRIEGRNVRLPLGEIDIVAYDKETLVIVEVKTKATLTYGSPLEMITQAKQRKLRQLALLLASRYGMVKYRIDAVAIYRPAGVGAGDGRGAEVKIEHIQNI